jgi:hypothetical protein
VNGSARWIIGLIVAMNAIWILFMSFTYHRIQSINQHELNLSRQITLMCEQHNEQRSLMNLMVSIDCQHLR